MLLQMAKFQYFLSLSSIPLYLSTYLSVCLSVCLSLYLSHLYPFIYWWTLCRFHILTTINDAAMNLGAYVSCWITAFVFFVFLDIYPRMELLSPMVVLFLAFWETVFYNGCINLHSNKGLIFNNSSYNPTSKKSNNPIRNGQKNWIYIFPKRICKWPTGTWEDAQHCSSSGKCKSKPQWDVASYLSEWLSSIKPHRTSTG